MRNDELEHVIPTIDLQESPFPYAKLRETCEKWGCFRVLNHNVPTPLMLEMKSVSRSMLDLPEETKIRNTYPRPTRGYIGRSTVNSMFEALGLYSTNTEAIESFCSQLGASSYQSDAHTVGLIKYQDPYTFCVDPSWRGSRTELHFMNYLKMKMSILLGVAQMNMGVMISYFNARFFVSSVDTRETIEKYAQATGDLIDDISDKIAKSLGLSGKDLFKNWSSLIRMNKYTFAPENTGPYGLDAHTDYNFLTLLQDDDIVGGLEMADSSGSFVSAEHYPGNFVINLGDVAVAWSNGRFAAAKHRVQRKDECSVRVSIGVFMVPPVNTRIEAPAELVDVEKPRLYAPFYYEDYKMLCFTNDMHNGEALQLLRI